MLKGYWIGIIYLCLIAFFTPFTFHLLTFQLSITDLLFGGITQSLAELWNLKIDPYEPFTSDSVQLYLLYLILFPFAILLFLIGKRIPFFQRNVTTIKGILTSFLVYYLALITLKYGLDKLNGQQFPFPEPNLLFTPMGYLDKDILYWSVMGASPGYVCFLGVIEIITALLILFRKTRVVGLVFALITYTQVVAINFGFDISVKLFSSYLLVITLTLLYPYLVITYQGLKSQTPILFSNQQFRQNKKCLIVKSLAIIFILVEACYPAYVSNKMNDEVPAEGNMYGAYEVINPSNPRGIKRIFIHKDDYLIMQTKDDEFVDFKISWSMDKDIIYITDYNNQIFTIPFRWTNDKTIVFEIDSLELQTSPISIKDLPLSQPLFHWTMD